MTSFSRLRTWEISMMPMKGSIYSKSLEEADKYKKWWTAGNSVRTKINIHTPSTASYSSQKKTKSFKETDINSNSISTLQKWQTRSQPFKISVELCLRCFRAWIVGQSRMSSCIGLLFKTKYSILDWSSLNKTGHWIMYSNTLFCKNGRWTLLASHRISKWFQR